MFFTKLFKLARRERHVKSPTTDDCKKLPVSYKQRLSAPLEDSALALGNRVKFHLDFRHSEYISGCTQHANKVCYYRLRGIDARHTGT